MAGTQPTVQSSSTTAMISGLAAATGGLARRLAQVLAGLLDALTALLTMAVTPKTQDQHNADVTKLKDQIIQAKADLAAEEARMAEERAGFRFPITTDPGAELPAYVGSERVKRSSEEEVLVSSAAGLRRNESLQYARSRA